MNSRLISIICLSICLKLFCQSNIALASTGSAGDGSRSTDKEIDRNKEYKDMVWIPGGTFLMGCADPSFPDSQPIHKVHLSGYWIDKTDVTNKQFAQFVDATNYVTVAERVPQQKDFPNAPPENLVAGSLVFLPPDHRVSLNDHYQWWQYVPGANWRHPEGPNSDIQERTNHPVVHIAWQDAIAYAKWAGKRLPTEAEFEYAARGGLKEQLYCWGNELKPNDKWQANIWQGQFPSVNTKDDGYVLTAPVASFPANGCGLYDMAGNVWQWCSDWYSADYYKTLDKKKITNSPQGPRDSFDPKEPTVAKRVQRGGSFLCSDQYCARFLVGARGKGEPDSSSCHVGFRCARDNNP